MNPNLFQIWVDLVEIDPDTGEVVKTIYEKLEQFDTFDEAKEIYNKIDVR